MAAAVAGVLSGAPSTVHALATGHDPLDSVRAAASLVPGADRLPPLRRLMAGLVVHAALSLGWAGVLACLLPRRLPRRRAAACGAAAGLGIAAFDLGVIGRRNDAIRALPATAQVADHMAFGAIVGWVLGRAARATSAGRSAPG
jgi:hypothetical protein